MNYKLKLSIRVCLGIALLLFLLYPKSNKKIPSYLLAFPKGDKNFEKKISTRSGVYKIWTEEKLSSWAVSQGFSVSKDTDAGSWQFKRGLIFNPPGLFFELQIDSQKTSEQARLGWLLMLDMGFFKENTNKGVISTSFKEYPNILRYEIYVDKIRFRTIEMGYGITEKSPVVLRLPFIRDKTGKVSIEIKLANHPNNFGILYDAFLVKEMR